MTRIRWQLYSGKFAGASTSLRIICKRDFTRASQSQNPKQRLWAILTRSWLWHVANRPSYPSDDQQRISNPRPPDPEAPDRSSRALSQLTLSCRACTAQIGRRVWPRRARTDLLWAIPLISAGRDSKVRFEGHTRPTCSLMLQLNVCFLGIC